LPVTRQSQHSDFAKALLLIHATALLPSPALSLPHTPQQQIDNEDAYGFPNTIGNSTTMPSMADAHQESPVNLQVKRLSRNHGGVGPAASDTPLPSREHSPRIPPRRQNSGGSTPRQRPTTLDIPGLTRSKVSPDGRISNRDVGSKLVIIMVGLPARGKSYITKKLARYLNWLQHDTRIFNVGERRRLVATHGPDKDLPNMSGPQAAAKALMGASDMPVPTLQLPPGPLSPGLEQLSNGLGKELVDELKEEELEHSAQFFDPSNLKAAMIREQCALDTLDELLEYIIEGGGSIGILDATNSTLARRKLIMEKIRERAGEINVLFIESVCEDKSLLEANMRLKLSGPDYKDKDPDASLADFRQRVTIYEKNYVPLGEYEEKNSMPYVKMIDVGRKVISYQIKGFLSSTAVYYLLNFNLAPRQIWITRHGESFDNVIGKIGGDSPLSNNGLKYGQSLDKFISAKRQEWVVHQQDKSANTHLPPLPGDTTPPNPYVSCEGDAQQAFCVWTSMLKRSVQTAQYFNDEDYDVKEMRMLNELYAGVMEGMTYAEIQLKYADEYAQRKKDKLQYRYPGPGGEGYLDVIHRIRPVIVELERMVDHCLLITHRSVARVLLAYFRGLSRDEVADLDCPLGMLYCLEPKPYGVEFKAYRYNPATGNFDYLPEYQLQRQTVLNN